MADDHNQGPYRGNETPARAAAAAGNDPLAELARLIGQNDPFSEFGNNARRAPAARQPELAPAWPPEPARLSPSSPPPQPAPFAAPQFAPQEFVRQPFGGAPLPVNNDVYNVEGHDQAYQSADSQPAGFGGPAYGAVGYGAPGYEASGFPVVPAVSDYEQDQFPNAPPQFGPQQLGTEDDYYDDVPPRRRVGILAIAGIFALAVIGTAGAFGYRAVFGSSSVSSPPPVIKAEQTPSKIVPAAVSKDAQNNKIITDRANERGPGEKLVSREEQPVTVTTVPAPPSQTTPFAVAPAPAQPLGNGLVGAEPKRIRTIAIKPDQVGDATAAAPDTVAPQPAPAMPPPMPAPQPAQAAPQPRVVAVAPRAAAPAPVPLQAPPQVQTPAAAPARPSSPPPQPQREAAETESARPPANAPLSLNPNAPSAPAPARSAAPQRTAAVAAPAAASGGGYGVQVSAQRSEEEAQAAFRSLQGKFPSQLGGRQPFIKRVDLGEKGIYFRAMVGPFGSSGEAGELCSSLKTAGGTCLVQKN